MEHYKKIKKTLSFLISGTAVNGFNIIVGLMLTAALYRNHSVEVIGQYLFLSAVGMLLSQVISFGNYELVLAKKEEIIRIFGSNMFYLQSYFIFYLCSSICLVILGVHIFKTLSYFDGLLVFLILVQRYLNTFAKNLDWYWVSEFIVKILIPFGMMVFIVTEAFKDIIVAASIIQFLACLVLILPVIQNFQFTKVMPISCVKYTFKNFQYVSMSIVDNLNNLLPTIIFGIFNMNTNITIWNICMQLYRAMTVQNEIVNNYFRFKGKGNLLPQRDLFKMVIQNFWLIIPISASALFLVFALDELVFDYLKISNFFDRSDLQIMYAEIFLFSCLQSFIIFDIYSSSRTYVMVLLLLRLLSLIAVMATGLFLEMYVVHIFIVYLIIRIMFTGLSAFRSFVYHAA